MREHKNTGKNFRIFSHYHFKQSANFASVILIGITISKDQRLAFCTNNDCNIQKAKITNNMARKGNAINFLDAYLKMLNNPK